ncbi:MAG: DUF2336 domain-containing protein [Hyphomicrobiales bacterium]
MADDELINNNCKPNPFDFDGADLSSIFDKFVTVYFDKKDVGNEKERQVISKILFNLLLKQDKSKKLNFSKKICSRADAPVSLVLYLAQEPIQIAESVLKKSPVLSDEDLIRIIKLRDYVHMIAIAARDVLSKAVSFALASYGNDLVRLHLAINKGADMSNHTFQIICDKSKNCFDILKEFLKRTDVPVKFITHLTQIVGDKAIEYMRANNFDEMLRDVEKSIEESAEHQDTEFVDIVKMHQEMAANGKNKSSNVDDLRRVLGENKYLEMICLLSFLTNMNLNYCYEIYKSRDIDELLLLFKKLDMSEDDVEKLLRIGNYEVLLTSKTRKLALSNFRKMKQSVAEKIVGLRQKMVGPAVV